VKYIEHSTQELITTRFPNPIQYTFLKDKQKYQDERELRVSLSALGIGHFVLDDLKHNRLSILFAICFQFYRRF
jgi:hypothetical protein